ncbi:MAG: PTS transporter subunit EIIC [Saccharofermentans sp.]|nr:PTS transporter subunit EIIC [Saccharofermentans sp.]
MSSIKTWFTNLFKIVGEIFAPIIPVIATMGIIKGLMDIYVLINPAYYYSKAFVLLYLFINTAYTFLPVLAAIGASFVFKGNKYIAAIIGLIMLNPDLVNIFDVANGAEPGVLWTWYGYWSIPNISYHGHIIPVIIIIWIMCRLEQWLNKVIYKTLQAFLVPVFTMFITAFLAMTVICPLFAMLGNPVYEGAKLALDLPYYLGNAVVGILYVPCNIFGADFMLSSYEASLIKDIGLNTFMPIISCCAMAQGAACLAVAFNTKDKSERSIIIPSSLSAFFGVTEPALYGVNLKYGKPFFAGIVGGAVGSVVAGVLNVAASSHGIYALSGCLITLDNELNYVISILIAAIIAFVISLLAGKSSSKATPKKSAKVKATKEKTAKKKTAKKKETQVEAEAEVVLATEESK